MSLLRPEDLRKITSDTEIEKMEKERGAKQLQQQQLAELREAFMSRDVHPEVMDRINRAVSIAAKNGQHQIQVVTFPSSYCNDGGRRMNTLDPEWPTSLEGFAKKAYDIIRRSSGRSATRYMPRSSTLRVACQAMLVCS